MGRAHLVFHGDLQDLLGRNKHDRGTVAYPVTRRASVKDVIEALGPPHPVVARLTINGPEADFSRLLEPGDRVEVFPETPPVDVTRPTLLKPVPLPVIRFQVDANVGKLARDLRMLGFDAAHDRTLPDAELALRAAEENRIVVSKDRNLLKHNSVTHAHLVRHEKPQEQLLSLLTHYGLAPPFAPFSRCIACNTPLVPVRKQDVLHKLEPLTKIHYHEFHACPRCGRVYWRGSHHEHMLDRLRAMGLERGEIQ